MVLRSFTPKGSLSSSMIFTFNIHGTLRIYKRFFIENNFKMFFTLIELVLFENSSPKGSFWNKNGSSNLYHHFENLVELFYFRALEDYTLQSKDVTAYSGLAGFSKCDHLCDSVKC